MIAAWEWLCAEAPGAARVDGFAIPNALYAVWLAAGASKRFRLEHKEEAAAFIAWWIQEGAAEYPAAAADVMPQMLAWLFEPVPNGRGDPSQRLTRLLTFIYRSRPDLQQAFDLNVPQGCAGLVEWWGKHGIHEYSHIVAGEGAVANRHHAHTSAPEENRANGMNLVGMAFGELGIGEDVRMAACAVEATGVPFVIVNFPKRIAARSNDLSAATSVGERPMYTHNLICLTGFDTLRTYAELGRSLFDKRCTIGYWPWELPQWPREAAMAFQIVDEVWASSQYTMRAYAGATTKPVCWMPMAVTIDRMQPLTRSALGLPNERFLFLFAFDANSHFARKNPIGTIRAFQTAFTGKNDVGLVIKVMNVANAHSDWRQVLDLVRHDERIFVIAETLNRGQTLGLIHSCDALVSLHRAEGFGRVLAEALLLERPVIATAFSGNLDFTTPDTSFLVDGPLIPLSDGDYPFGQGQEWCEPDIGMAAEQMRLCYGNPNESSRRARAGRALMETRHNPRAVGLRYVERLRALGLAGVAPQSFNAR